ncbi:MAG: thioesterase, partial [Pseudomonadota bacterium]
MTPDDDPARALAHTPRDPDFERVVRASFARQGFLVDNGAELAAVAPGRISIALPYRAAITQQQGYFHGAAIGA